MSTSEEALAQAEAIADGCKIAFKPKEDGNLGGFALVVIPETEEPEPDENGNVTKAVVAGCYGAGTTPTMELMLKMHTESVMAHMDTPQEISGLMLGLVDVARRRAHELDTETGEE